MNNTYAKAYTEVIEIINHFSEEEYKKIPKEKIEYYENNKDKNYIFKIDPNIDLDKQNISKKAYSILVSLFRDYFATDRQKQILDDLLMQNEQKLEEEKLIKYNPNEIFRKDKNSKEKIEEVSLIIVEKEKWYKKILNYFKSIFKK